MEYGLKYLISPDNSFWLDVSEIVNSKNTTMTSSLCTNSFKSAVNTLSFILTGNVSRTGSDIREAVVSMLMEALEEGTTTYVRLERSQVAIFTGIIDLSSFSIQSKKVEGDIEISCRDMSTLHLDDTIDKHIFLEDKRVSEVVSMLLSTAGYAAGKDEITDEDDYDIPAFVIDPDEDSDTYRDVIDTLLFEAGGYVVSANSEGIIDIIKIPTTPPEEQPDGITYAISSGLDSKASVLDNDGVKLEWSTLGETEESQTVYVDSSISRSLDDEGNVVGLEIPDKGYFPEDGDIIASYQEFDAKLLDREYNTGVSRKENKDLTIICVRDVSTEIIASDASGNTVDNDEAWDYPVLPSIGMEKNPTIWPLKAWYLLRNKYGSTLNLQQFVLHGRVLFRNKVFYSSVPASCKNPEEYTSTYVFTQKHAERFAKFYWHFKKYSRVVHSWTEYEYSTKKEGDIVTINHKGTSTGQPAIIVQRTIGFEGGRTKTEYKALSIGSYDEYEVKNWGTSPNYNTSKPANPLMPKKEYTIFDSPVLSGLFTSAIIYEDEEKNSWFLIDDAAVISESITDADWQKDMPENVPDGYYLFCREWDYETGKWEYYRMSGTDGKPGRDFSVSTSPTLYYNSRRRKGSMSITVNVTPINLSEAAQIEYILRTIGLSINENVITIPQGVYPSSILVDVIVTDPDTDYGPVTKSLEILGQEAEDSRPIYIGALAENPNPDAYSYNFAEGDFYWNTNTHLAMRYSISEEGDYYWKVADNKDPNFSEIMSAVAADAFSAIEPGSTTMAQFGYFANIIAQYIQAEMIETMRLALKKGGAIYGGGYEYDSNTGQIENPSGDEGFCLSDDGLLRAVKAIFQDILVSSYDGEHLLLDTVRTVPAGSVNAQYDASYWEPIDFYNAIGTEEGQCTYNGEPYHYKKNYKPTLNLNASANAYNGGNDANNQSNEMLIIVDGTLHFNVSGSGSWSGPSIGGGSITVGCSISKNGVFVDGQSGQDVHYTGDISVKKGDIIKIDVTCEAWAPPVDPAHPEETSSAYAYCNFTSSFVPLREGYIYLYYGSTRQLTIETYDGNARNAVLTSSAWNSNENLTLADCSALLNLMDSFPSNTPIMAAQGDTIQVYRNKAWTTYQLQSFKYNSQKVAFTTTNGTIIECGFNSYGTLSTVPISSLSPPIKLSIHVNEVKGGLRFGCMLPYDSYSSIGSPEKKVPEIYAQSIIADQISGGKVYGAVFN